MKAINGRHKKVFTGKEKIRVKCGLILTKNG